jgi:hypothetical protein
MATNFPFIPADPQNIPLRPLDKGVQLHLPPQGLPSGAFLQARNLSVNPSGLTRRPVYRLYGSSLGGVDYGPIEDLQIFWTTAGLHKAILWDQKFIYEVTSTAFTGKYWTYDVGTVTVDAATTVEGAGGMLWDTAASEVQAGDIMILDPDASGDGPEEIEIASITDDDTLELVTACTGTYGAGSDYEIRRAFDADDPFMIDYTVVPGTANKIVFADGSRMLYCYDGTDFTEFATEAYIPRAVTYFQNRTWMGNVGADGNEYKQRIWWSDTFPDVATFQATSYLDLPYQQGQLMKLVPMGLYLSAYFNDRIFFGRQSNIYGLPLQFDPIETGRIGLVGTRAVVPWIGGHFFVGQDNIYWLPGNGGPLEPIGTPIVKESIRECSYLWRIRAVHYPLVDSILFAFPRDGEEFERIWLFNYKSKSWSEWPITGEMLSVTSFTTPVTYSTWVDYAPYETGTVSGVAAGTTLTLAGAGADFTAMDFAPLVDGDFVHIIDEDGDGDEEVTTYTVASVTNATHLEINETFANTFNGKSYQIVDQENTYDALSVYDSYESIQPAASIGQTLYLGAGDILHYFQEAGSSDVGGAGPPVSLLTGDIDLDLPDTKKVWTRISMKIEEYTDVELAFTASVSTNRGRTWKSIGTLYIREDNDEGFLTFRTIGSTARFKFVSGTLTEPYTINELNIRARPMGSDIPGRMN